VLLAPLLACREPADPPAERPAEPAPDTTPVACGESEAHTLYWEVWGILDETYPYFDYKHVDWPALGEACEVHVCDADAGYRDFRDDAMTCLLAPLADHHVAITDRFGTFNRYGLPPDAPNSDVELVAELLDPGSLVDEGYTRTGTLGGGRYGYVATYTWVSSVLDAEDVWALPDAFGDVEGIVLDARDNGGGNPALAAVLAGRFASDGESPYGWIQERDLGNGDPYQLGEREPLTLLDDWVSPEPFDGPVAVLLGHECVSACEHFAAMMDTLVPASRSFGATTCGASGYPDDYALSDGETGLRASTVMTTLAATGEPLEWNGVPPDVEVAWVGQGRDEVLDAAIAWMGGG
jgi:hypothetical protein